MRRATSFPALQPSTKYRWNAFMARPCSCGGQPAASAWRRRANSSGAGPARRHRVPGHSLVGGGWRRPRPSVPVGSRGLVARGEAGEAAGYGPSDTGPSDLPPRGGLRLAGSPDPAGAWRPDRGAPDESHRAAEPHGGDGPAASDRRRRRIALACSLARARSTDSWPRSGSTRRTSLKRQRGAHRRTLCRPPD